VRMNPTKNRRRFRQPVGGRKVVDRRGKHDLNYITTSTSPNVVEHQIEKLRNVANSPKGVHLRTNARWVQHTRKKMPACDVLLPLIDKLGRFTGENIYVSPMQPASYIGSVVSTIFRRIFNLNVVRNANDRDVHVRQGILLRCAAYYALTKNDYFWDRVLFLSRRMKKNWRTISKMVHKFSSKLDVDTRFVYSHVCYQTQWFTFRARRPRDKSRIPYGSYFPEGVVRSARKQYDMVWHTFTRMSQL